MVKRIKHVAAAIIALMMLVMLLPLSTLAESEAQTTKIDFSSMRLIVATEDADLLADDAEHLVSGYKDVYILQFGTEEEAEAAYEKYAAKADFVEIDTGMLIAEDEAVETVTTETVMTKEENPLDEIEEALTETEADTYDIALIDTGANDAAKAVSVIGDDGADDHGHGSAMEKHIREVNPNARILSIKALDANGKGDVSAVYAAMQIAIEKKVGIINLSISAFMPVGSELIESAVQEAKDKGIIVVGAAGNNNKNARYFVPGGINDAVIAGACDKDGNRLTFSNFGKTVDYYLPAASTSEAAAKLSGIISRYGAAGIDVQIEQMKANAAIIPEDGQGKTDLYYKEGEFEVAWIGGTTGDWDAASFHWIADDNYGNARVAYCLDNGVIPPRDAQMYWFNLTTNKAVIGHILYHGSASTLNNQFGVQIAVWMARGYSPYEATGYAAESPWELAYIYNGYNESAANSVVSYGQSLYNNAVSAVNSGETFWADAVDAYWPNYENVQGLTALVAGWSPDGYLKLHKASSNASITDGNSCYSLAGAVYTVYQGSTVKGTLTTDANGDTGTIKLPMGSYTVKETKAAPGYQLDPSSHSVTISANHTSTSPALLNVTDTPGMDPAAIEITKISNSEYATQYPLAGAQFEIKYYDNTAGDISGTPLRTWIIETKYNSTAKKYTASLRPDYLVEGSDELFFNESGMASLPVGTISVEEIKPAAGYTLTDASLKDGEGNEVALVDGKYIGVITMQDGAAVLRYGNFYTMLNTPIEVHTLATNKANGTHYAGTDGPVTIVDTVTMNGTDCEKLINEDGEWVYIKYRLKTEMRILGTDEVVASGVKNFVTDDFDGHTEDVTLVIEDPSALEGKTVYVAEYLYTYVTKNVDGERVEEETLVAAEDETIFPDIDDETKETQRIHFPKIETTLADDAGEHATTVMKDLILTDTVVYESLIPGHTYVMKGKLMDKETGEPLLDDDGGEITAEKEFTPEEGDGSVEITFTFPAVTLHGRSIVAFEALYEDGVEVAVHADIEDEAQTVELEESKIKTTLTDEAGEKETTVQTDLVLIDTVAFENLATDAEYTVKGILMDQETGEPLLDDDGNEVTSEKTFTPEEPDGEVEIEFTFPAVKLHGRTVVAFEELWYEEMQICVHADIEDEAQAEDLHKTEIATTFVEKESEEHETFVAAELVLIDTVTYKDVAKGANYTVKGMIMDKETGEPLLDEEGNPFIAEKTFTPEGPEGTVDLAFTIPASIIYDGKTMVAFEELYYKEVLITDHKDLDDEGQTVEVNPVDLKTTLIDDATHTHVANAFVEVSLTDTVAYTGLVKGRTYTVKGVLMSKETGEAALDEDGEEITAETEFEAEDVEGTVELTFTFKNQKLMGDTLVAFETLFEADTQIADHQDIEDEDQSVRLPFIGTKLTLNDTSKQFGAEKGLQLNDAVELNNLDLNTTYVIKGYLVNKTTGNFLNKDGSEVKDKEKADFTQIKFLATKHDALLNVPFTIDASGISFDIVCFEELYAIGEDEDGNETVTLVAEHSDPEDEAQTVHYVPKTGDRSDALTWILCMVAALLMGSAAATFYFRKRSHN